MRRCSVGVATLLIALLPFAAPRVVRSQSRYTFARIADSAQHPGLGGAGCVGINNLGAVVLNFAPTGAGYTQVWRGDGQSFVQVAPVTWGDCPSINDSGEE